MNCYQLVLKCTSWLKKYILYMSIFFLSNNFDLLQIYFLSRVCIFQNKYQNKLYFGSLVYTLKESYFTKNTN